MTIRLLARENHPAAAVVKPDDPGKKHVVVAKQALWH
jgi:hypothetical protein